MLKTSALFRQYKSCLHPLDCLQTQTCGLCAFFTNLLPAWHPLTLRERCLDDVTLDDL